MLEYILIGLEIFHSVLRVRFMEGLIIISEAQRCLNNNHALSALDSAKVELISLPETASVYLTALSARTYME